MLGALATQHTCFEEDLVEEGAGIPTHINLDLHKAVRDGILAYFVGLVYIKVYEFRILEKNKQFKFTCREITFLYRS